MGRKSMSSETTGARAIRATRSHGKPHHGASRIPTALAEPAWMRDDFTEAFEESDWADDGRDMEPLLEHVERFND